MLAANDANNNASVEHDQNYALGPDVDLSKYRAVSI
jgi:hypothetical protein